MYTPRVRLRITAYHMVEASPGALDPVPGRRDRAVLPGDAGVDELALSGDLTRRRVDEEHRHGAAPYKRADAGMGSGAARVRRRPAPPRRGGEDAPRLRDRPRPVRALGLRARQRARGHRRARAAPLRRGAVRTRRGADHGGAQARGAARVLPRAASTRARSRTTRPSSCPRPSAPSGCRGRSRPTRSRALLDRIPAGTPLELRDRALFELAYACGLRAEELVTLDVGTRRLRRRGGARRGQGRQDARRAGRRARAAARSARYCERARPALRDRPRRRARRCSCPSPGGGCRPPTCAGGCASGRARPPPGPASRRTRCATRSPPTCSREARICGRSRSCWATRASPRRRSTLG